MASKFDEISTDYTDENGVTFLDGYKPNQDEGKVLGYFINGEVYWTNPDYQFDSLVIETVKELKANFLIEKLKSENNKESEETN
jgi:hypothetical protein